MTDAIVTESLRKVYPPPTGRRTVPGLPPSRLPGAMSMSTPTRSGDGSIVALESLDLSIPQGEFFGLLGPNGAGKTTTIGILTTRVKATSGRALVAGADVNAEDVAVRQRIGVVPQRPNPDRSLTAIENLVFHAAYFGYDMGRAAKHARELLERLGLSGREDAKVDQLSGGQQQRLMIARALIHEPEVLFLDEPTVGLDPQARHDLWGILRDLHSQGRTIVMTTHYMEEADQLCQRVAIIDQGKLLAVDTPDALKGRAPGGTLIELALDGQARDAAHAAETVEGVTRAEGFGNELRAYSDRGGEPIPGLIRAVEQSGRHVQNIHFTLPSLESLFISLTGRKLD